MSIAEKSIYYRIHGSDTPSPTHAPVVLLHGLMGFAANWGKIWPKFTDRKVLVLDQRGHGRSFQAPSGQYGPADYANDLNHLLIDLGWEKAHIVGHSMGGRVALRFASLFPQKTLSLTMEDSGAEANPNRIKWIVSLLGSIPTPFANRESAKKFFEENFKSDPMTGSFLHSNLEQKDSGEYDWRFFAPAMKETIEKGRATDAMSELATLRAPTLIVRGSRSVEFPADEAQRMAALRKNIVFKTVEGAGHYVHAEKPEEFSGFLLGFLSDVESGQIK